MPVWQPRRLNTNTKSKKRNSLNPLELAHTVVDALEEKKGENILLLDLQKVAMFTEYFIICTGTSDRMLDALADGVEEQVRLKHQFKGRKEGQPTSGWVIVDFGSVLVHLFAQEVRDYYKLEELWKEGKVLLRLQ
jgi:ribosome-associated protein